jgi:DNA-binding transcriptional ArsR family regulator
MIILPCSIVVLDRGARSMVVDVDHSELIDYRQWSMDISREQATTWAGWFKALSDPTRILILNLLVTESRPMNVGEIVEALDVGQSTISHHLQILSETCFVLVERVGNSSWWQINERCLDCFPSAAELIMGRLPITVPWDASAATCDIGTC